MFTDIPTHGVEVGLVIGLRKVHCGVIHGFVFLFELRVWLVWLVGGLDCIEFCLVGRLVGSLVLCCGVRSVGACPVLRPFIWNIAIAHFKNYRNLLLISGNAYIIVNPMLIIYNYLLNDIKNHTRFLGDRLGLRQPPP